MEVILLSDKKMFSTFLEIKGQADIACVDVSVPEGLRQAELLRSAFPGMVLIVVAEPTMSPLAYMKPDIMAASLLLKPLEEERICSAFHEILSRMFPEPGPGIFLLETRDEKQRIPYNHILYFEAREKKIYVCMWEKEYGFYGTIDQLESSLPATFVRCHRSYLVNRDFIESVRLPAGCLKLKGNIELPVSRSYKEKFRRMGI